jgi:hypothetical protein
MNSLQIEKLGFWLRPASRRASILVLLMFISGAAWAQVSEQVQAPETQRSSRLMRAGYLNINVMLQSGSRPFSERVNPTEIFKEPVDFRTTQAIPSGALPDFALGVRLWRNLAVGVGATYFRVGEDVELTGEVPHPLFYGRPRDLGGRQLNGYRHTQTGIHAHAVVTVPLASRLDVALSAGPSLFLVTQDRVSKVDVKLPGPTHDEFEVAPMVQSVGERAFGANAGIDFTYHLVRRLEPGAVFWTAGLGFFVRWTGATVGFASEVESGEPVSLDVGGLQYGAGLRFRF